MTIDVHVLGTASARPTAQRAVSGSVVFCEDGLVVVDAGEGFQTRFEHQRKRQKVSGMKRRLRPHRIGALVFTHGHLDHTWGALPWLQTLSLDRREPAMLVLAPTSTDVFEALLAGEPIPNGTPPADLAVQWKAWFEVGGFGGFSYPLRWVLGDVTHDRWAELDPDTMQATLLDAMPQPAGWRRARLVPILTHHTVPSCGWMVEQTGSPGVFDRERANELGLTEQQRGVLARGDDLEHENTTLQAASFRGPSTPSLRVVISGDTAEQAPGFDNDLCPDLLIHESTFLEAQTDKAAEHLHTTAKGAARTAADCNAGVLALTHYSSRIKSVQEPLNEAREALADLNEALPALALQDGDVLSVKHDECTHLVATASGWEKVSIPPNR